MGREVEIISDHEFFEGRKEYAHIGGCYYAARLAINELLTKEKRQAGAVIFREAHPGYIMPVGVWNVRENVRAALTTAPSRFETLQQALAHISGRMDRQQRHPARLPYPEKDRRLCLALTPSSPEGVAPLRTCR